MNTPDTLRGWLETCDLLGEDPIVPKDDVLAHADAWKEDINLKHIASDQVERVIQQNDALRQRLEEAYEALTNELCDCGMREDPRRSLHATSCMWAQWLDAALAAGES